MVTIQHRRPLTRGNDPGSDCRHDDIGQRQLLERRQRPQLRSVRRYQANDDLHGDQASFNDPHGAGIFPCPPRRGLATVAAEPAEMLM